MRLVKINAVVINALQNNCNFYLYMSYILYIFTSLNRYKQIKIMKTLEGYEVIKVSSYEVNVSIYMKTEYSDKEYENGFSGVVRDTNMDDRFICNVFCIWNSKGDCIYLSNSWGQIKGYKIQIT